MLKIRVKIRGLVTEIVQLLGLCLQPPVCRPLNALP